MSFALGLCGEYGIVLSGVGFQTPLMWNGEIKRDKHASDGSSLSLTYSYWVVVYSNRVRTGLRSPCDKSEVTLRSCRPRLNYGVHGMAGGYVSVRSSSLITGEICNTV